MEARDLIDKAASRLGTCAAVARAVGVTPQRLHEWKQGHRTCPADRVDQLAELAGLSMEQRVRAVWEAVRKGAGKAVALALLGAVAITLSLSLSGQSAPSVAGNGSFRRR